MAHSLRYLISLLGLAVTAFAQAPSTIQSVRFTVFSVRPIGDVMWRPRANAPPQKLLFYPTARSPRHEYRGAMPLRFVDPNTNAVVAEATIPADIQDALLLFTPLEPEPATTGNGANAARYQISVLDDGGARNGPGGLAIINLSGLELSGTVGKNAVTLTPALNPTLTVGRSARIALRAAFKGKSYPSYTAALELARNERALLILLPPYYKGSLEVQSRMLLDEPPGIPDVHLR